MNTINMKYKQGDLLKAFEDGEVDVIAHQTNTSYGMKAGIAKKIAEQYPLSSFLDSGCRRHFIGRALLIEIKKSSCIFNLYTQNKVGKCTDEETFEMRIGWLKSALIDMSYYLPDTNTKIGLCLLSSGLASCPKLKEKYRYAINPDLEYFKKYIAPIVEETLKDYNVTVYYL